MTEKSKKTLTERLELSQNLFWAAVTLSILWAFSGLVISPSQEAAIRHSGRGIWQPGYYIGAFCAGLGPIVGCVVVYVMRKRQKDKVVSAITGLFVGTCLLAGGFLFMAASLERRSIPKILSETKIRKSCDNGEKKSVRIPKTLSGTGRRKNQTDEEKKSGEESGSQPMDRLKK